MNTKVSLLKLKKSFRLLENYYFADTCVCEYSFQMVNLTLLKMYTKYFFTNFNLGLNLHNSKCYFRTVIHKSLLGKYIYIFQLRCRDRFFLKIIRPDLSSEYLLYEPLLSSFEWPSYIFFGHSEINLVNFSVIMF